MHKRFFPVQAAEGVAMGLLRDWARDVHHDDLDDQLLDLTLYVHDLSRRIAGLPAIHQGNVPELHALLQQLQTERKLTDVELLRIVLHRVERISTWLLRYERHPDNPNKKADEA